jgi:hypothetical protein
MQHTDIGLATLIMIEDNVTDTKIVDGNQYCIDVNI